MIKVKFFRNNYKTNLIVEDETTPREVLEDNDVDYSGATVAVDGSPLKIGEMDMSFAELGVREQCALTVVVKAANAASVKIVPGAIIVTSEYSYDDIEKLKKYRPKALTLYDEDKEPIFSIGLAREGSLGNINNVGASFAKTQAEKATITMSNYAKSTDDVKKAIADCFGEGLLLLNKLEQTLASVMEEIDKDLAEIDAHIQVEV